MDRLEEESVDYHDDPRDADWVPLKKRKKSAKLSTKKRLKTLYKDNPESNCQDEVFLCPFCDFEAKTGREDVTEHIWANHEYSSCKICPYAGPSQGHDQQHNPQGSLTLVTINERKYQCKIVAGGVECPKCNLILISKILVIRHLINKHLNEK